MNHNRPFYGKQISVIIPCMDRTEMLQSTLSRWFEQIYKPCQIVIVDYSSKRSIFSEVKRYTERYRKTLDYQKDYSTADCLLLEVRGKQYFNMSHAINYGVARASCEVISVAGTDTMPSPFYIDTVMMALEEKSFTRCMNGRLSFSKKAFDEINGFPEMFEYWGGEDDVISNQLVNIGFKLVDLDGFMAHNLQNFESDSFPFLQKNPRIVNRAFGTKTPQEGANINMARYMKYMDKVATKNNYYDSYGQANPILIKPEDDISEGEKQPDILKRSVSLLEVKDKSYFGALCGVFIPCMNRNDDIAENLPHWINQIYQNKKIVIIDYNSSVPVFESVKKICETLKKKLSYNTDHPEADVVVYRMDGYEFFNISHAYNYAIKKTECDIVCTVCGDSSPWDYYLNICMNLVKDDNILQFHWGLHTITKSNWRRLNGHQEFLYGWGAEDDDFRLRAQMMDLRLLILPKHIVYHKEQTAEDKARYRKVQSITESSLLNTQMFSVYRAKHGFVGNYNLPIGESNPVKFVPAGEEKMVHFWGCKCPEKGIEAAQEPIKYHETFKVFYICSPETVDWHLITDGKKFECVDFFINKNESLDKYLYQVSILAV